MQLTPQGLALIDRVVTDHVANQHRLLAALPPELRGPVGAGLKAWLAGLETGARPAAPGTGR